MLPRKLARRPSTGIEGTEVSETQIKKLEENAA
jgi:hypothetical protein